MHLKQIIQKRQKEAQQKKNGNTRPILKVEKESFKELFKIEAQNYILDIGEDKEFSYEESFKNIIVNNKSYDNNTVENLVNVLYLYLKGNSNSPLNLRKGILLAGSYGVGKTLLLTSLVNTFNQISDPKKVTKIHSDEIASSIISGSYDYLVKKPLYIEDIGREAQNINVYGTVYYPFYQLILDRYKHGSWTFGCTNFSPKSLREMYGGYIADRMNAMFNVIEVEGKTKRD